MKISHIHPELSAIVVVPDEGNLFTGRESDSDSCAPRMVVGGAALVSMLTGDTKISEYDLSDPHVAVERLLRCGETFANKTPMRIDPDCTVSLTPAHDELDSGVQVAGLLFEQPSGN